MTSNNQIDQVELALQRISNMQDKSNQKITIINHHRVLMLIIKLNKF
jgi:hypothetical protein